jgi:hypothetical protein
VSHERLEKKEEQGSSKEKEEKWTEKGKGHAK